MTKLLQCSRYGSDIMSILVFSIASADHLKDVENLKGLIECGFYRIRTGHI